MLQKYFIKIVILLATLVFTSCIVINLTKQNNTTLTKCTKHNFVLKKKLVTVQYGKIFNYYNTTLYPFVKRKAALGCMRPIWPIKSLAITFTCDSCTIMHKNWLKNRKENGDF